MRFTGFLAIVGVASLCVFDGRANAAKPGPADSVPPRQEISSIDITQARTDGTTIVARDEQGHRWPLTLDSALQSTAHRLLAVVRPEVGALVAIEFRTGKLRVMTEWPSASSREESILLGRQFPAASVFKIVTTAALIEHAHIGLERKVCTEGGMHRIESAHLQAPRTGIVQCRPFSEALGFSRNAVFAQLASQYLKPDDLENYADRFGFGSTLPLELDIPLGQYRSEVDLLSFARTATGFSGSTLSPVGAAYLAYVIAGDGRTSPLRIIDSDVSSPTLASDSFVAIRPETARAMRRMMEVTVRRGTCWRAFHDSRGQPYLPGISVAGKTGTLGEQDSVYSWFVGFAPSQKPEVVVSVLLKNGAIWHQKANEVGRDWLIEYFSQRRVGPKLASHANAM